MEDINNKKRKYTNTITKSETKDNKLELLMSIVPKAKGEQYIYLIQSFGVNFQMKVLASGTYNNKQLSLIESNVKDKLVIFSPIRADMKEKILDALETAFKSTRNGKGVCVVVPFSSMIGKTAFAFLSNNENIIEELNL